MNMPMFTQLVGSRALICPGVCCPQCLCAIVPWCLLIELSYFWFPSSPKMAQLHVTLQLDTWILVSFFWFFFLPVFFENLCSSFAEPTTFCIKLKFIYIHREVKSRFSQSDSGAHGLWRRQAHWLSAICMKNDLEPEECGQRKNHRRTYPLAWLPVEREWSWARPGGRTLLLVV